MLDVDFASLPPALKYAMMLGAFVGTLFYIVRGIKAPASSEQLTAIRTAELAAELADAKVRDDLQQVVRITREAMEQRIDAVANGVRLQFESVANEMKRDLGELHRRIDEVARQAHENDVDIARIEAAAAAAAAAPRRR